jgi:hypothetical protein
MTQMHSYTLITHEDGSNTIVGATTTYSDRHTTSIYHHGSFYYHHDILLPSQAHGNLAAARSAAKRGSWIRYSSKE